MKGDDLSESDNVVRYVKPSLILDDGTPEGSNFQLRLKETGLSVNWLEIFGPNRSKQLAEVRRLFRLEVSGNGRFAEINVGTLMRAVRMEISTLRVIHSPLEEEGGFMADPSHSEIVGLPPRDSDQASLIGDLIAECVSDMHPAK